MKLKTIHLYQLVGGFAEDKDKAKQMRQNTLWPRVKNGLKTKLDCWSGRCNAIIHSRLT